MSIGSEALDFGDAPQLQNAALAGGYPTTLSRSGARHGINPDFRMGALIDAEPDGQPNADATGDDIAALKDEDGVVFLNALTAGGTAQIQVTVSTTGRLDAWVDFNANFSWADPGERVFTAQAVSGGINNLSFAIPANAKPGDTFARFRYSRGGVQNLMDRPAKARWRITRSTLAEDNCSTSEMRRNCSPTSWRVVTLRRFRAMARATASIQTSIWANSSTVNQTASQMSPRSVMMVESPLWTTKTGCVSSHRWSRTVTPALKSSPQRLVASMPGSISHQLLVGGTRGPHFQ